MLQPKFSNEDVQEAALALMAPGEEGKKTKRPADVVAERKQFQSEVSNALSHKHRAKAIYRQMDYELLKWTREMVDDIITEKEKVIEAYRKKEQNRQKVIDQLNLLLQENDFTLHELYPNSSFEEPKKRGLYKKSAVTESESETSKRILTYKFKCHIFDRDYYWAGSGYIPTPFRCHLAKGHIIDSCYLPEDQWLKTTKKTSQVIPPEFKKTADKLINEANKKGIAKTRKDLQFNAN